MRLRILSVKRHHKVIVHDKTELESELILSLDVIIDAMHHHIGTSLTCLDGHGVGLQTIVQTLYGVVALVYDLHTERTVIIACNRRHDRNAEILDILLHRVGRYGVGEHDILRIVICHISLVARRSRQHCRESECNIYQILLHMHACINIPCSVLSANPAPRCRSAG